MSAGIEEIAASLRTARQTKALTQKELGQRVGLPQSHISKIEKGSVDLQLSSLVEIARALGLELKLVPRRALPAVEGTIRAHGPSVETSRAVNLLNEQTQLAERIRTSFPDLSQVEGFEKVIRTVSSLRYDAGQLKALEEALQPARRLKSLIEAQGGAAVLARRLEDATLALRQFEKLQVQTPPIETLRLPAYRLEEDDE